MSPAHLNDHHHAAAPLLPPLKTNRDSRSIKKPSPSSSSSSTTAAAAAAPLLSASAAAKPSQQQQQQQRHPVIIYTHSPKIIHTQPRDFMALVQKLTGLSRSSSQPDDELKLPPQAEAAANSDGGDNAEAKGSKAAGAVTTGGEDNECSSVITEENCGSSSVGDGGQVNSCFAAAPSFEASNGNSSYLSNLPFMPNNAADLLCSSHPNFYDFNEATVFGFPANNVRTTNYMSYSGFEATNNFREF